MQQTNERLGACPECGEAIYSRHLLITYDTNGDTAHFAECPGCQTVVHPAVR